VLHDVNEKLFTYIKI